MEAPKQTAEVTAWKAEKAPYKPRHSRGIWYIINYNNHIWFWKNEIFDTMMFFYLSVVILQSYRYFIIMMFLQHDDSFYTVCCFMDFVLYCIHYVDSTAFFVVLRIVYLFPEFKNSLYNLYISMLTLFQQDHANTYYSYRFCAMSTFCGNMDLTRPG